MTPVRHEEWAVRRGWPYREVAVVWHGSPYREVAVVWHGSPYREVAAIAADQRLLIADSTVNPSSGT
jgi:hypothetical protein